jgi:hypothetical protein
MARVLAGLVCCLLALPARSAPAATWDVTRKTVIDPLNSELHRHIPSYLKARDLAAILALYTTDTGTGLTWEEVQSFYTERDETVRRWQGPGGTESIRARWERLLALLPEIERADLRIHRVDWRHPEADGWPAEVRLIVRGRCRDGTLCQVDQRARLGVRQTDGQWRITREEIVAREMVARRSPRYEDVTRAAGIDSVHTNALSPVFLLVQDKMGSSGSAVADVDGDGCEDLFLAGHPDAVLYRNDCDGTFTDVTAAAGLPHPYPAAATGVVFLDYDNDGWPDLYVAAAAGGDRLFRNTGGGRFTDVTAAAGIPPGRWGSMPLAADYDRDGDLDLYIARMGDHEKRPPRPSYEAHNGVPNTLYRNDGDGTFTDVTARAGVGDPGWNLAGAWGDYDDDGWPDIYLANEFGTNALYRNERDGTFTERARETGTTDPGSGMGVAWGDYDNNGFLDIFVSSMYANSRWALVHPDFPAPLPWYARVLAVFTDEVQRRSDRYFEMLTRGSTLLRNDGDGTFTDVSDAAGVRDAQWGWAAEFLDYDNDGLLDVFATDGFVTNPIPDDV